jgi:hypothetical protein
MKPSLGLDASTGTHPAGGSHLGFESMLSTQVSLLNSISVPAASCAAQSILMSAQIIPLAV